MEKAVSRCRGRFARKHACFDGVAGAVQISNLNSISIVCQNEFKRSTMAANASKSRRNDFWWSLPSSLDGPIRTSQWVLCDDPLSIRPVIAQSNRPAEQNSLFKKCTGFEPGSAKTNHSVALETKTMNVHKTNCFGETPLVRRTWCSFLFYRFRYDNRIRNGFQFTISCPLLAR